MIENTTRNELEQPDNQSFYIEDLGKKAQEDRLKEVLGEDRQTILKDHMPVPQQGIKFATGDVKSSEADKRTFSVSRVDGEGVEVKVFVPEYFNTLRFRPYTLEELLNMPPKKWLVEHLFGAKDLGMLFGPPGCGKTFVIIDLIICMCSGIPWAGQFNIPIPLTVWYCAGEGISGLQSRFAAAADNRGIETLKNLSFFDAVPQFFDLKSGDGIDKFIQDFQTCQREGGAPAPDVVIVDTLNCATVGADENSAKDMGIVLHQAKKMAESLGCAVLFIHHTTKDGSAERGSGSMRGAMGIMMGIKVGTDTGISAGLECSKLKDEEKWKMTNFCLRKSDSRPSAYVEWFKPGEVASGAPLSKIASIKSRAIDEMRKSPDAHLTCDYFAGKFKENEDYVRRILKALVDDGTCVQTLTDQTKSPSKNNPFIFKLKT